ncbi:hypothetical protein N9M03_00625 [bacterium]|nr:hypothetical protein [bacterium]
MRDQDGNPTVKPVTEIRVTNGTLTDDGDGVVSLQTGGGGGGGTSSGPAGAVQLSDGGGGFTNDLDLDYDTTNDRLNLGDSALGTAATAVPGVVTIVDSWSIATYRSSRYSVQITDTITSEYQVSDMSVLQDGATTTFNEFGILFTGSNPLGTFTSNISAGNTRLIFTPTNANAMNIKVSRTLLEV